MKVDESSRAEPRRSSSVQRRRPPFWIALGFLLAFAATVLTVVLTGLLARAPESERPGENASAVRGDSPAPAE